MPTLWKPCEVNDYIKNGIIKRPTYVMREKIYLNIMLYWCISHGTLSENVREVCKS